ncbi:tetratricopeptide repeat protein [Candidatus Uabimicrobium amorphum]|uniref:Lipopolysaccharide assembly protein B n=1 Tax=Uabimicrobium amorphum TaxID=2596890 RepID=A0A5S9INF1_UABAM|nr:hypothetical protein [Candidatus Uabimicrobium amorphum]BBM84741.1 lipopolysaccharide assembly protein B [Candidatus Uabimicrobium amorphum]
MSNSWDERTLREYTKNLLQKGQKDKLYELLQGDEFIACQIEYFENYQATYDSLKHGIEAFINGATIDDEYKLCTLALKADQIALQAKENISQAFTWAQQGKIQLSLTCLQTLKEREFYIAALLLIWIETVRQQSLPPQKRTAKQIDYVIHTIEKRVPPTHNIVDRSFIEWWLEIVSVTAEPKSIIRILKIFHAQLLTDFATIFVKKNQFSKALTIIKNISCDIQKFMLLKSIIEALQNAKNHLQILSQVLEMTQNLKRNYDKFPLLLKICPVLYEAGETEKARQLFEQVLLIAQQDTSQIFSIIRALTEEEILYQPDLFHQLHKTILAMEENDKGKALLYADECLQKIGKHENILNIFRQSLQHVEGDEKTKCLSRITSHKVRKLVKSDNISQAIEIIQNIEDHEEQSKLLLKTTRLLQKTTVANKLSFFLQILDITKNAEYSKLTASSAQVILHIAPILQQEMQYKEAAGQAYQLALNIIQDQNDHDHHIMPFILNMTDHWQNTGIIPYNIFQQILQMVKNHYSDQVKFSALIALTEALVTTKDFQQALEIASDIENLEYKLRFLLKTAQLLQNSGANEKAEKAFEKAFSIAQNKISQFNSREQAKIIDYLLSKINTMKQYENRIFQQVLKITKDIQEHYHKSNALCSIARNLHKNTPGYCEFSQQMIKIIHDMERKEVRIDTLLRVVKIWAQAGNLQGALEAINNTISSFDILMYKAQIQQQIGNEKQALQTFKEALQTNPHAEFGNYESETLSFVSQNLAQADRVPQALELAQNISSPKHKGEFLLEIAKILQKAGKKEKVSQILHQVVTTISNIESDEAQLDSLSQVAKFLRKAKGIPEKFSLFQKVLQVRQDYWKFKEEVFKDLAQILQDLKHPEKFNIFLQFLTENYPAKDKNERFLSSIRALLKVGLFEQSLQLTKNMEEVGYQVKSLLQITLAVQKVENVSQKSALFEQILSIAKSWKNNDIMYLPYIALFLNNAGEKEQATKIFHQVMQNAKNDYVLSELAKNLVRAGKFSHVLNIKIEDDIHRYMTLAELAKIAAQHKNFEQALNIAKNIDDTFFADRFTALLAISKNLRNAKNVHDKANLCQQIVTLAQSIDIPENKSNLLFIASQIQQEVEEKEQAAQTFQQALKIAQSTADRFYKFEVLLEVVQTILDTKNTDTTTEFFQQILQIARCIKNDWHQSQALFYIVHAMTKTNDTASVSQLFPQILKLAQNIKDNTCKAKVFVSIATASAQTNHIEFFQNFLSTTSMSNTCLATVLREWQKSLVENVPNSIATLKQTFVMFPFGHSMAYHSICMLQIAHIKAQNWTFYHKIKECIHTK